VSAGAEDLAEQWRRDLAAWAIPPEILAQAEQPPWVHPVALFTVPAVIPDSTSHRIARAALGGAGSVLDVGCGGGRASLALVPPADLVIGVDHQQGMLDAFAAAAQVRGVAHAEYLGDWADVADEVPAADVVVCHHVAYNVPVILGLLTSLDAHARRRVVLEVPMTHPMSALSPLWQEFWGLDRPTRPGGADLAAIARALGFDAHLEVWIDDSWGVRVELDEAERVRATRVRLCLPAEREPEVAAALRRQAAPPPRQIATIWWDTQTPMSALARGARGSG